MLKKFSCIFLFSISVIVNSNAGIINGFLKFGESVVNCFDEETTIDAIASVFGTVLAANFLFSDHERSPETFIKDDFGKKFLLCGASLAVSSYVTLGWERHVTNLLSVGSSYIISELTKDIFPSTLSLICTAAGCCSTSMFVTHLINILKEKWSGEEAKASDEVVQIKVKPQKSKKV